MRIDSRFKVRDIAGKAIVILQGTLGADTTKVLSLNQTALFLWEKFAAVEDFSLDQIKEALMEEYGIDSQRASTDSETWLKQLAEQNIILD